MGEKQEVSTIDSARRWVVQNKLKAVGCLWLSGITSSIAYNWSRPGMKTSVKIIHARAIFDGLKPLHCKPIHMNNMLP